MIRARKEDHQHHAHQHQRESEQRRPLVVLPTSNKLPVSGSNTHAGVLIPSSVGATGGCSTNTVAAATTSTITTTTTNNNNNNSSSVNSPSPNPRGVTSNNKPASAAAWTTNQLKNATAASSSTVKQLYHELKQHNARRKYRKTSFYGSRSKKGDEHHPTPHHDWTAQVPKRMWFTTLGIFLVLPVLIFLWKEIMLKPPLGDGQQQLRQRNGAAAVGAGHALIQPKNRYVTWMNEEKDVTGAPPLEEEFGYNNETNAALSRNETDRVDGEWKDNTIIAEKSRDTETGDKSLADLLKEKK